MMSSRDDYSAPVSRGGTQEHQLSQITLSHPKNYLGVPLCVAADGNTGVKISNSLVGVPRRAINGAVEFGLVNKDCHLTQLGSFCVNSVAQATSLETSIGELETFKGSTDRFLTHAPACFSPVISQLLKAHQPTQQLINLLPETGSLRLPGVVIEAVKQSPDLARQFLRDPAEFGLDNVDSEVAIHDASKLYEPTAYSGPVIYQYKTVLYHLGVLTERGKDTSAVVPEDDVWELDFEYAPLWNRRGGQ